MSEEQTPTDTETAIAGIVAIAAIGGALLNLPEEARRMFFRNLNIGRSEAVRGLADVLPGVERRWTSGCQTAYEGLLRSLRESAAPPPARKLR